MKARKIFRTLLTVCLSLGLPMGVLAEPIAWPVSGGGNGHFYDFIIGPSTESWAQQHLATLGLEFNGMPGHLATITSAEELEWITAHFLVLLPIESCIYLGGWNDGFLTEEPCFFSGGQGWYSGSWHWVTGETWDYAAWAEGEPTGGADGCNVEFALSYLYYWFGPEGRVGFNNLTFEYWATAAALLVEYDGLAATDLPPLDHPIPTQSTTWGGLKALYR